MWRIGSRKENTSCWRCTRVSGTCSMWWCLQFWIGCTRYLSGNFWNKEFQIHFTNLERGHWCIGYGQPCQKGIFWNRPEILRTNCENSRNWFQLWEDQNFLWFEIKCFLFTVMARIYTVSFSEKFTQNCQFKSIYQLFSGESVLQYKILNINGTIMKNEALFQN